jgi:hypothetical protein
MESVVSAVVVYTGWNRLCCPMELESEFDGVEEMEKNNSEDDVAKLPSFIDHANTKRPSK